MRCNIKITLAKLLDPSTLDSEIQPKVSPIVTQLNTATDQFARALKGELTLQDNIKSVVKSVAIPHNTLTEVNLNTNADIEGVILAQSDKLTTGFYWELGNTKGAIKVQITNSTSATSNIKLICFLK